MNQFRFAGTSVRIVPTVPGDVHNHGESRFFLNISRRRNAMNFAYLTVWDSDPSIKYDEHSRFDSRQHAEAIRHPVLITGCRRWRGLLVLRSILNSLPTEDQPKFTVVQFDKVVKALSSVAMPLPELLWSSIAVAKFIKKNSGKHGSKSQKIHGLNHLSRDLDSSWKDYLGMIPVYLVPYTGYQIG